MGETISTIETHQLSLQIGDNPLTITGTGGVEIQSGTAIDGSAAASWTITNAGTIEGPGPEGIGIDLQAASYVTNTGTIAGGAYGVRISSGSATIVNSGTIAGARDAIAFQGTSADRLIIDPGAVFIGQVSGSTLPGATDVVELAEGATAGVIGTLSNFGSQLVNFGTMQVDAGAAWLLGASDTLDGSVAISNFGTLINTAGITVGGLGIGVYASAVVVNSGTITASANEAVHGDDVGVTLDNSGTITGVVQLSGGGLVTNQAGGVIKTTAGYAIESSTQTVDTIVNAGTIRSIGPGSRTAVVLHGTDTIINTGTIVGFQGGAGVILAQGGVVVNSGVIGGTYFLRDSGSYSTALAATGLAVTDGAATITNAGTIQGSDDAINFAAGTAGFADRLIVDPGAVFIGTVAGGTATGATTVLELAAGPIQGATGTITGFGTQFTNFGSLQIDSGATWAVSGTSAGSAVELAGPHADRLVLQPGASLIASFVTAVGGGVVELAPGATAGLIGTLAGFDAQLTGFGSLQVDAGAAWLLGASDTIDGSVTISNFGTLINTAGITVGGLGIGVYASAVVVNSGTITASAAASAVHGIGVGITLDNSGTITGAVQLSGGGLVTNQAGGVIKTTAGYAIESSTQTVDTIVNAGTIRSIGPGSRTAVVLHGADTIINTGTIVGFQGGAGVILAQGGVVVNSGVIGGTYFLRDSGSYSTALAATGLAVTDGAATITNAGTIQGSDDAINFAAGTAGFADRLIVDPGAVFIGTVAGGTATAATTVLELAAGPTPGTIGTISGFGDQFTHFGSIQIDSGATWAVSGTFSAAETISLTGTKAFFAFDAGRAFAPTIAGFNNTDTLDVRDVVADHATIVGGTTLDLTDNGAIIASLTLGPFPEGYFGAMSDGSGGTDITFSSGGSYIGGPPCYCRGTRILTDCGEVPVEDLRIGDGLVTGAGAVRPIVWIGQRSYEGRFIETNGEVLPVVIRAGALADGVPHRDLWVSPLHAMFLDGALVPAAALVNDISIVKSRSVDRVEYFHIELASHDIIIAEGAASESFVDDDSRGMFQNAATFRELYPHSLPAEARYCAPRVEEGEWLEEVHRLLAERAMSWSPERHEPRANHLMSGRRRA